MEGNSPLNRNTETGSRDATPESLPHPGERELALTISSECKQKMNHRRISYEYRVLSWVIMKVESPVHQIAMNATDPRGRPTAVDRKLKIRL
jgi:hypothetical protein